MSGRQTIWSPAVRAVREVLRTAPRPLSTAQIAAIVPYEQSTVRQSVQLLGRFGFAHAKCDGPDRRAPMWRTNEPTSPSERTP